ncbi:helix-turn-helix domain-containing protein [Halorubrum sp. DTA98]|uniref:helix-turn-helix domain-containing protein n=1 Tax=Halorubrum sp. DTA98 TaxID=3402163 RepID=UPI003AADD516
MRSFTLTITIPSTDQHPMHALIDEHPAVHRSEMLQWNTADPTSVAVLFRVLAAREPYEAALHGTDTIDEYELVDGDPGELYLYVREAATPSHRAFVDPFSDTDLIAVPPVTYLPDRRVTVRFLGRTADVDAALSALPDGYDVELRTVTGMGPPDRRGALTKRQREALRAADRVGYYEVPREGSVAAVAAELGLSTSAAGEHLRKAEAALVGSHLDGRM